MQPQDGDSGYWYCADPVYLKADRDQVLLARPASIQNGEADRLIASFNRLFDEDGIQLYKGTAERWYLRAEEPWQLQTTPLEQVEGRVVRELMPQGVDALRWSKTLTEIEMLFFGHSVNRQRERAGRSLINSLWLWGEHQQQVDHLPWDLLVGEHPLLKGIHRLQQIPILPGDAAFDEWISTPGNGLMILDGLRHYQRAAMQNEIADYLQTLEQRLFAPALFALKQGLLNELVIRPANGTSYNIRRSHLGRFWRRTKPIWEHFSPHQNGAVNIVSISC